jgi:hypothetical protein
MQHRAKIIMLVLATQARLYYHTEAGSQRALVADGLKYPQGLSQPLNANYSLKRRESTTNRPTHGSRYIVGREMMRHPSQPSHG